MLVQFNAFLSTGQFERATALAKASASQATSAEIDAIALAVARAFVNDQVNFDHATGIVAQLWHAWFERGVPPLTAEIYSAFDSAEYGDVEGEHDDDPIEYRAKPALSSIISRHGA